MSVYYRYGGPVSDEQALTVPCPLCWSLSGQSCTYTWPGNNASGYANVHYYEDAGYTRIDRYSPKTRARIALVGTPTARVHNDRRRLYSLREDRGRRLKTMRQLRDWLLTHGDIFVERRGEE